MGTLCPSPRVTAPRGEGTVPGARSLCALASARCCLGIFKGEGLSLGRGRGRCAPSGAPTLCLQPAGTFSGETETLQWRDLGADSLRPRGVLLYRSCCSPPPGIKLPTSASGIEGKIDVCVLPTWQALKLRCGNVGALNVCSTKECCSSDLGMNRFPSWACLFKLM